MRLLRDFMNRLDDLGISSLWGGSPPPPPPTKETVTEHHKCRHRHSRRPFTIVVHGIPCTLKKASMCPACAEPYLNRFSTLCGACRHPIYPSVAVGQAPIGAPHPYTHMNPSCNAMGAMLCGHWGPGRLITLHELDPETYPPDTSSVAEHAISAGRTNGAKL